MISPESLAVSQARADGFSELHLASLAAEGKTTFRQNQRNQLAARAKQRAAAGIAGVDRERAHAIIAQQRKSSRDEALSGSGVFDTSDACSSFREASGTCKNSLYRSRQVRLPYGQV